MNENYDRLVSMLKEYNSAYYSGNPIISDKFYDTLYKSVKEMEEEDPLLIDPTSPTQRVVDPVTGKVNKHLYKLLSLKNVYKHNDALKWAVKTGVDSFTLEPKLDGMAVAIRYEEGTLVSCSTRGNGEYGEDCTTKVAQLPSVPTIINDDDTIEIRGELIIPRSMKESIKEDFKNLRNLVAGTLASNDNQKMLERGVVFVAYDAYNSSGKIGKTQKETLQFVGKLGINTVDSVLVNKDEIIDRLLEFEERHRENYPFDTDGMVIKINDNDLYMDSGSSSKYPLGARAFKYEPEGAVTQLKLVMWNMSRNGEFTPVGIVDPVNLNGVTVTRVNLYNFNEIKRLDLRLGDTVHVIRAGDVTPKITEVVGIDEPRGSRIEYPNECSFCLKSLAYNERSGKPRCTNGLDCVHQMKCSIEHMVSKQGFNIKGLSDSTIARLMSLNLVKTFEDIFTLRWEDIEKTYLGKHNRIKDLLKVIDDCKQIPLSNFIYSLGIPDMGLSKSKELAKKYVTLDNWLESEDKPNESTVDRINRLLNVGVVVLNEHR